MTTVAASTAVAASHPVRAWSGVPALLALLAGAFLLHIAVGAKPLPLATVVNALTHFDPTVFDPPAGRFFVAYDDAGRPVATGAWRRRPDVHDLGLERAAEIKRMYVAPEARGRGLSRTVLAHLEETARAAGHDGLVLETGTRQPAALALYTACGYVPVTAYGHYKDAPESVYLGKRWD